MKLVCELPGSDSDIFGGCFLENGDIVLADFNSGHCLYYSNKNLVRKITLRGFARDVINRTPSELLISSKVNSIGHLERYDLQKMQKYQNITQKNVHVFHLAKSSEFIFAACSDFILKLDHEGNTVEEIPVDKSTYSVAVNQQQEIISSSCHTNQVTVMNQTGKKLYSYSHEILTFPVSLDVNFSGNIFVAGQLSNNIHVLTSKADLLKIFEVASPRCIKFKENSYTCIVGSAGKCTTKIYEFLPKGLEA